VGAGTSTGFISGTSSGDHNVAPPGGRHGAFDALQCLSGYAKSIRMRGFAFIPSRVIMRAVAFIILSLLVVEFDAGR
jgi:hypothetical protein